MFRKIVRTFHVRDAVSLQFALGLANYRDLRVAKDRVRLLQRIVRLLARSQDCVARRNLAFVNRDMHEHVLSGDVADRPKVRRARLHGFIRLDAGDVMAINACFIQLQPVDIRHASHGVKQLVGFEFALDAMVVHVHDFFIAAFANAKDLCLGVHVDAFIAIVFGECFADVVIFAGKQMAAAQYDARLRSHARKKLTEFAADVPAAEHNERLR